MNNEDIIVVNSKKEYHDSEMVFSFYNSGSDFKVDDKQKYKINTTAKEIMALSKALKVYQEDGFKEIFLNYINEVDPEKKYPEFTPKFNKAKELARAVSELANDEDSLVQLSEYCMETPPTYDDDFKINKKIEVVTINGVEQDINEYR